MNLTPPLPSLPAEDDSHLRYLLTAYVFGEISSAGRREVEDHLERCEECRAEHAALSELTDSIATALTDETPSGDAPSGDAPSGAPESQKLEPARYERVLSVARRRPQSVWIHRCLATAAALMLAALGVSSVIPTLGSKRLARVYHEPAPSASVASNEVALGDVVKLEGYNFSPPLTQAEPSAGRKFTVEAPASERPSSELHELTDNFDATAATRQLAREKLGTTLERAADRGVMLSGRSTDIPKGADASGLAAAGDDAPVSFSADEAEYESEEDEADYDIGSDYTVLGEAAERAAPIGAPRASGDAARTTLRTRTKAAAKRKSRSLSTVTRGQVTGGEVLESARPAGAPAPAPATDPASPPMDTAAIDADAKKNWSFQTRDFGAEPSSPQAGGGQAPAQAEGKAIVYLDNVERLKPPVDKFAVPVDGVLSNDRRFSGVGVPAEPGGADGNRRDGQAQVQEYSPPADEGRGEALGLVRQGVPSKAKEITTTRKSQRHAETQFSAPLGGGAEPASREGGRANVKQDAGLSGRSGGGAGPVRAGVGGDAAGAYNKRWERPGEEFDDELSGEFSEANIPYDRAFTFPDADAWAKVQERARQSVLDLEQKVSENSNLSIPGEDGLIGSDDDRVVMSGAITTYGGGKIAAGKPTAGGRFLSPTESEVRAYAYYQQLDRRLTWGRFRAQRLEIPPPAVGDEGLGRLGFRDKYGVNPFVDTRSDNQSTFAMDVDTASFTRARDILRAGSLPDPKQVRVEEFVNYFRQHYPADSKHAFSLFSEGAPAPFGNTGVELLQITVKARELLKAERRNAVLTFCLDTSGSMYLEDRVELLKTSLGTLVRSLQPEDRVAIVAYGAQAYLILPHTPARDAKRILDALSSLNPNGASNVEAGLELAYRIADETFQPRALNRVVLCSDGVATAGARGPEAILQKVKVYAQRGIYLSTVGFGRQKYNDRMMERLANEGNGRYDFVASAEEAKTVLGTQLPSTLQVLAKDAKIQVVFNEDVVGHYRLLGYENRDIKDHLFRDDTVDAGEVGPGTTVTALYEVARRPNVHGSLGEVFVRYHDTTTLQVEELKFPLQPVVMKNSLRDTTENFRIVACAAEAAELLRKSYWARNGSFENIRNVLRTLPPDSHPQLPELREVVERAEALTLTRIGNETRQSEIGLPPPAAVGGDR